jgi:hypothetical protein
MRAARFTDVDWPRRVIVLREHKTASATGQERLIALGRAYRLVRWLYRRRRRGQQHIFLNSRGRRWTKDFCKLFRKFARRAGVRDEVSGYSLRHGFAVGAIENGLGERQVADLLGHASTRFVSWYARKTKSHARHLGKMLDLAHGRPETELPEVGDEAPPAIKPPAEEEPAFNAGAQVQRDDADRHYAVVLPTMRALRAQGQTFQTIADHLNRLGLSTRNGKPWGASRVRQILVRPQHGRQPFADPAAVADALAVARDLRQGGHTLDAIAQELNRRGLRCQKGGAWQAVYVWRLLKAPAEGNGTHEP